jgi:hypothetical protein
MLVLHNQELYCLRRNCGLVPNNQPSGEDLVGVSIIVSLEYRWFEWGLHCIILVWRLVPWWAWVVVFYFPDILGVRLTTCPCHWSTQFFACTRWQDHPMIVEILNLGCSSAPFFMQDPTFSNIRKCHKKRQVLQYTNIQSWGRSKIFL